MEELVCILVIVFCLLFLFLAYAVCDQQCHAFLLHSTVPASLLLPEAAEHRHQGKKYRTISLYSYHHSLLAVHHCLHLNEQSIMSVPNCFKVIDHGAVFCIHVCFLGFVLICFFGNDSTNT